MEAADLHGLYVPLLTPLYKGEVDQESLLRLLGSVESYVDGYAVCASTGEGEKLTDEQWQAVVEATIHNTAKPVIAAILREDKEDIVRLTALAKKLDVSAVMIAAPSNIDSEIVEFFQEITRLVPLPVVAYNTEQSSLKTEAAIMELDQKIIGFKDSSSNILFFKRLIELRRVNKIHFSILQGMENQLLESVGCDGHLHSLINIEPELSKRMFDNPSDEVNRQMLLLYDKFHLGEAEWYKYLKQELFDRKIIKSIECCNLSEG